MRWFVGAVALVLAVVWVRCVVEGRAELAEARATGDPLERLEHLQNAMRWYTPGASAPRAAADAITETARRAEAAGDHAVALAAWRRLRGGVLSTRHLYSPFGQRLAEANERIAELTAEHQLALGHPTIRGRDRATLVADHLALLHQDPTPATGWALLVLFGFLGWVAGALMLIRRGFDAELRIQPPFARWAALTLACFGLWIVGLIQA